MFRGCIHKDIPWTQNSCKNVTHIGHSPPSRGCDYISTLSITPQATMQGCREPRRTPQGGSDTMGENASAHGTCLFQLLHYCLPQDTVKKSLTMLSLAQNSLLDIQNILFQEINLIQYQIIQNTLNVSSHENTEKNTLNTQQVSYLGLECSKLSG